MEKKRKRASNSKKITDYPFKKFKPSPPRVPPPPPDTNYMPEALNSVYSYSRRKNHCGIQSPWPRTQFAFWPSEQKYEVFRIKENLYLKKILSYGDPWKFLPFELKVMIERYTTQPIVQYAPCKNCLQHFWHLIMNPNLFTYKEQYYLQDRLKVLSSEMRAK